MFVRELYPALTGSKTPASTSGRSTGRKSPIGWTNNQWGMKKTPLIEVSLYASRFWYIKKPRSLNGCAVFHRTI